MMNQAMTLQVALENLLAHAPESCGNESCDCLHYKTALEDARAALDSSRAEGEPPQGITKERLQQIRDRLDEDKYPGHAEMAESDIVSLLAAIDARAGEQAAPGLREAVNDLLRRWSERKWNSENVKATAAYLQRELEETVLRAALTTPVPREPDHTERVGICAIDHTPHKVDMTTCRDWRPIPAAPAPVKDARPSLRTLRRCPKCKSADVIRGGHPDWEWECVACGEKFTEDKDSSEGQQPIQAIAGAHRSGHASPSGAGTRSTSKDDRSVPESPAQAAPTLREWSEYWIQYWRKPQHPNPPNDAEYAAQLARECCADQIEDAALAAPPESGTGLRDRNPPIVEYGHPTWPLCEHGKQPDDYCEQCAAAPDTPSEGKQ